MSSVPEALTLPGFYQSVLLSRPPDSSRIKSVLSVSLSWAVSLWRHRGTVRPRVSLGEQIMYI